MQLNGSCHCGAVHFSVHSNHPYPYQRCYCSICRKTQGGGGYSINISASAASMKIKGADHITIYHARIKPESGGRARTSTAQRSFCKHCGSALWLYSPEWPELIHPFASAVDTRLPTPPEHTHLMLEFKAPWIEVNASGNDKQFEGYPEESIAQWHERLGLAENNDVLPD